VLNFFYFGTSVCRVDDCEGSMQQFSRRAGRNIVLRNSDCLAVRSNGYDGGLVVTTEPLRNDELLQVILYYLNLLVTTSALYIFFTTVTFVTVIAIFLLKEDAKL